MKKRSLVDIIKQRDILLEQLINLNDYLPYENKKLPIKIINRSEKFIYLRDFIARKVQNTLGTDLDPNGKSFINGYANGILDSIQIIRSITEKDLKREK